MSMRGGKTLGFLVICVLQSSLGVEPRAPQSKEGITTEALTEIKTILTSVQGSLLTSVSLIQDQVDHFAKQYSSSLHDRLSKLESRLSTIEVDIKDVREKGKAWDNFRDHASSWAELMMSVDTKVHHLSMSQSERLTSMTNQLSSLQTAVGEGLEKLNTRLTYLERQARDVQEGKDLSSMIKNLEARLNEISANQHRARTRLGRVVAPPCVELKDIVRRSESKVDSIFAILTDENLKDPSNSYDKDYQDFVHGEELATHEEEAELQMNKMFRKITQPLKKTSKNVSKKLDRAIEDVTYLLRDAVSDVDRKFNDFFNMTMEMFEHQHGQLESYERSFKGLKQCCTGTNSDLSDFKARSLSSLDKLDSFMSRNSVDQTSDRCREQVRFDADRILSAIKEQEKLILYGIDAFGRRGSTDVNETLSRSEESTTTTTRSTTDTSTSSTVEAQTVTTTSPMTPSTSTSTVSAEASRLILRTCEDLMNAGFIESKVYTVDSDDMSNQNGRDYRRRFCDQETSGGGWTVQFSWTYLIIVHGLLHLGLNSRNYL